MYRLKFDFIGTFKVSFENDNSWLKTMGANSLITYAEVDLNVDI